MTEQKQIATLPPIEEIQGGVPLSPRTGEPRRPITVWLAAISAYLAVAALAAAYGWHWYRAVYPETYAGSARIIRWLDPEPGKWQSLAIEGGLAAALVLAAGAIGVAGFQAWNGWGWARWAGLIAVALAGGFTAVVSDLGYIGLGLSAVAAALIWFPSRYYRQWRQVRNERPEPYRRPGQIFYGRLPRFR